MSTIADKIKAFRKEKGLSQERFAELCRLSLRTIQRIENLENEPRGNTLIQISNVLGIASEDLFDKPKSAPNKHILKKILNLGFLILLNIVFVLITAYLTIGSPHNPSSLFAAYLISFLLPMFLVFLTPHTTGSSRFLKFGVGYLVYAILLWIKTGLPIAFLSGLIPCSIISISVIYFGHLLFKLASMLREH